MSYKNDGYLVVRGAFPKSYINSVKEQSIHLFRTMSKKAFQKNEDMLFELFYRDKDLFNLTKSLCTAIPGVIQLSLHKRIIDLLVKIGLEMPLISSLPKITPGMPFERECYLARQIWATSKGSLNSVTVWMPLVEIDGEMGFIEVAPGSHLEGLYLHDNEIIKRGYTDDRFISVPLSSGDLLFMSNFLVHRSDTNKSKNRAKWSCQFSFNDASRPLFPEPYLEEIQKTFY
jgi:Phytanoyl-CoA dioxygenase (PhyH)